jgi:hypothetical protein
VRLSRECLGRGRREGLYEERGCIEFLKDMGIRIEEGVYILRAWGKECLL